LILAGRWSDAQKQVKEALSLAHRIGERIFVPDLLLLNARIALGCNDQEGARDAMRRSLDEARAMRALWQELAALVALNELDAASSAMRAELASAYARLTEGLDTPLAEKARTLIAGGKTPRPPKARKS
jgi:hypothetical protein